MGFEWLKAGAFFGSIVYALVGVVVFWLSFVVIDKITPYNLWEEIVEKQNVALGIVVGLDEPGHLHHRCGCCARVMSLERRCSARCTSRQRRARTPVNASLKRSPAATALRCSVIRPTAELATRCALRSNSRGESVNEARCARGRMPCAARRFRGALPGVRARLCRGRRCWRTTGGVPALPRLRGRRWPAGAISAAARSAGAGLARAARFVNCSPRLSERSAQSARSEFCGATPNRAPQRSLKRSVDRRSVSPRRPPPAAKPR
jgi:putative membrane protein